MLPNTNWCSFSRKPWCIASAGIHLSSCASDKGGFIKQHFQWWHTWIQEKGQPCSRLSNPQTVPGKNKDHILEIKSLFTMRDLRLGRFRVVRMGKGSKAMFKAYTNWRNRCSGAYKFVFLPFQVYAMVWRWKSGYVGSRTSPSTSKFRSTGFFCLKKNYNLIPDSGCDAVNTVLH